MIITDAKVGPKFGCGGGNEWKLRVRFIFYGWWLIGPQAAWSKQRNDKCLRNIKTFTWQKFWKIIVDWICAEDVRVSLSLKLAVRWGSIGSANIESSLRQMDGREVRSRGRNLTCLFYFISSWINLPSLMSCVIKLRTSPRFIHLCKPVVHIITLSPRRNVPCSRGAIKI